MGEFDSEKYWRDAALSKLPFIEDNSSTGIILAMDELLFPFCRKADVLITRFAFDDVLKDYLQTVGFEFQCNSRDYHTQKADAAQSLFEIIARDERKFDAFRADCRACTDFAPYSIVPYAEELARKAGLPTNLPPGETVRQVNSKAYSTLLGQKLGFGAHSEMVYCGAELSAKGRRFLENGPFLVKDLYGVSGKGNILINSVRMLERIVKHVEAAELKGNQSHFVIEAFLDKELDFSCGLVINENGQMEIVSIQKMINHQFAYGGSETADAEFCSFLERQNYFDTVAEIAGALYEAGYFGPVCLDSMLLKTGAIVPIIEINARRSMGFINYQVDCRLKQFGVKGTLMKLDLGITDSLTVEAILTNLAAKKVLFRKERESGVLPLSANTLLGNRRFQAEGGAPQVLKGRMYFSVVVPKASDQTRRTDLLRETVAVFEELGCKIYSKV